MLESVFDSAKTAEQENQLLKMGLGKSSLREAYTDGAASNRRHSVDRCSGAIVTNILDPFPADEKQVFYSEELPDFIIPLKNELAQRQKRRAAEIARLIVERAAIPDFAKDVAKNTKLVIEALEKLLAELTKGTVGPACYDRRRRAYPCRQRRFWLATPCGSQQGMRGFQCQRIGPRNFLKGRRPPF